MPGMQKPHCRPPQAAKASAYALALVGVDALERDDRPTGDLGQRLLARHDGLAVDQHGAAAALAGRRAAVLRRGDVELLAERGEQVGMVGPHGDLVAVEREPDRADGVLAGVQPVTSTWSSGLRGFDDAPLGRDPGVHLGPAVAVEVEQRALVLRAPVEVAAGGDQLVAGGEGLRHDLAGRGDDAALGQRRRRPPRRRPWPRRRPRCRSGRRRPASRARCGSPAGCPGSGRGRSGSACCSRTGSARRPAGPSPGSVSGQRRSLQIIIPTIPPKARHTPKPSSPGSK